MFHDFLRFLHPAKASLAVGGAVLALASAAPALHGGVVCLENQTQRPFAFRRTQDLGPGGPAVVTSVLKAPDTEEPVLATMAVGQELPFQPESLLVLKCPDSFKGQVQFHVLDGKWKVIAKLTLWNNPDCKFGQMILLADASQDLALAPTDDPIVHALVTPSEYTPHQAGSGEETETPVAAGATVPETCPAPDGH